jgi:predicted SAM-dependent methyltransferase/limonene-1,2-epoxide hydrolase
MSTVTLPATRRLHIGGETRTPGWEVMNVVPGEHVDHVGRAEDLSRFSDDTFAAMYASHVLEHIAPPGPLERGLREWYRVLAPGGTLHVSVPDLDILARLFADRDGLNPNERYKVMLMMFGAHSDAYDRHEIGFNEEFLRFFLESAGFVNVRRVESLGQFRDTSELVFRGVRISLNVIAEKPGSRPEARPGSAGGRARKQEDRRMTAAAASGNPLLDYALNNPGRPLTKWRGYFDVYHRHLQRFRAAPVTILEFGIFRGGSLQMWRHYFGARARVIGVDIQPECKAFEEEGIAVRIGDQEDRAFLRRLAAEFAPFDVVIEDGGHHMGQQIATFEEIFPRMTPHGVYVAEDLHTSYWPEYGGGYRQQGTFIEYAKALVDRLNAWHTRTPEQFSVDDFTLQAGSMHFYDSMLVVERRPFEEPRKLRSGGVPAQ